MPQGNAQKPFIIGSIKSDADRAKLVTALAGQGKTLDDVDVISMQQAEDRGLFTNPQFLAYIRQMGFNTPQEMKATYERMERNNAEGNAMPEEEGAEG